MERLYDVLLYLVRQVPFTPADRAAAERTLAAEFNIDVAAETAAAGEPAPAETPGATPGPAGLGSAGPGPGPGQPALTGPGPQEP